MFISVVNLNFAANIDSINEDVNVVLQQEKSDSEIDITPEALSINKEIGQQQIHRFRKIPSKTSGRNSHCIWSMVVLGWTFRCNLVFKIGYL